MLVATVRRRPCRRCPPATSSARVSSAAVAVARSTTLVIPSPRGEQLGLLGRVQRARGEA